MSTRYRIQLYFPIEKLECALEELNNLSESITDKRMSITLPNGKKIVVSHTRFSVPDKSKRKLNNETPHFSYSTVLLLSADSIIQEYLLGTLDEPATINKDYPIEAFLISLGIGQKFSRITIGAVASSQNKILRYSPNMHQQMNEILSHCDGLFGLIDIDAGDDQYIEMILLADTKTQIFIDVVNSHDGDNIDYIVDAVQRQLTE